MEYRPRVNVLALTRNQDAVLVRQYRHAIQRTILELPGGAPDQHDNSPVSAAKRELLEETGYTSDEFVETGRLAPNPATHDDLLHCFLATNAVQVGKPRPDDTEQLELALMPLDELVRLAAGGGLMHALQTAALFLASAHLGRIH